MLELIILSIIIGSIYFLVMESSIPKKSNCSYSASIMTDILAFVVGVYVSHIGYTTKNEILFIFGNAIIVEHIWQLFYFKDRQSELI
jgi:hypothetical protein